MAASLRLRVAHIITQLELGGAQRNTLYTVGHLDAERFDPILICGPGGLIDDEAGDGRWITHYVGSLVRPVQPWKDALALAALYKLLRALKPHIVHTHSSKAGILGRVAAYLAGVPVIIHTFHGFGFTPEQPGWERGLFIGIEKICARLSTHFIFVSEQNRMEAAELNIGPNIPNSLIRSGIPISDTPAEILWGRQPGGTADRRAEPSGFREQAGIPPKAWLVTYIGNFKPQKNPLDLARIADLVLKQNQDVHFLLVGDGELRPAVESWVRDHQIEAHVHFAGWLQRRQDLVRIRSESNCFLLTSLWEGLPRALVEAAAANLPAVAYDVNGVCEVLHDGENGFLIPPRNVDLAAEKILWLKDHAAEAGQMGIKGRSLVEKEFDINRMVRQQETLYQELYEAVPLKEFYEPLWSSPSQ